MQLPIFQTQNKDLSLMQTKWKSVLDKLIANPLVQGLIINDIQIVSGHPNSINHMLGRALVGWLPISQDAQAELWDSQSTNQTPKLTLLLNSSADVTVSLYVF